MQRKKKTAVVKAVEVRACKKLNTTDDELDTLGKMVTNKLRAMDLVQRRLAITLLTDVLFLGERRKLLPQSTVTLKPDRIQAVHTDMSENQCCPTETQCPSLDISKSELEVSSHYQKSRIKTEPAEVTLEHSDASDEDTSWDIADVKVEPEVEVIVEDHSVELGCREILLASSDEKPVDAESGHQGTGSVNVMIKQILNNSLVTNGKEQTQDREPSRKNVVRTGKCYTCTTCQKTFTTSSNLTSHLRLHSGERPYVCPTCGNSFNKGSDLKRHSRTHSGERPYCCETCGKGFVKRSDLNGHRRVHTGERPYQCPTCSKRFVNGSDFTCHLRIHTGERPYVCHKCGKAFVKSTDLTRHVRTHTNQLKHQCEPCGKCFKQINELAKHQKQGSCVAPLYQTQF